MITQGYIGPGNNGNEDVTILHSSRTGALPPDVV